MGRAVVVAAFVVLTPVLVGVDQVGVAVRMLVVAGPMLELAERPTRVVVGYVIVVVRVHDAWMGMLVVDVAGDFLAGPGDGHGIPPGDLAGFYRRPPDADLRD
jgi:hypothetical protein